MTALGPPGACPRCGTTYASGQEYCLECGLRLPTQAGVFSGLASKWAARGGYPGDWIWPVPVFLVLAALGALAAILLSGGTSGGTPTVATPPAVTTTSSGPPVSVPATTILSAPPTTTAAPPVPRPARRGLVSWPARDGYTIVVQSIPATAGRAGAIRTAKEAAAAGLPQVGVLDSSQYSSLHPGYYVVFSGVYSSNAKASGHLSQAAGLGFTSAYVRPITR